MTPGSQAIFSRSAASCKLQHSEVHSASPGAGRRAHRRLSGRSTIPSPSRSPWSYKKPRRCARGWPEATPDPNRLPRQVPCQNRLHFLQAGAQQCVGPLNDLQGLSEVVSQHAYNCCLKFPRHEGFQPPIPHARRGNEAFDRSHVAPLLAFDNGLHQKPVDYILPSYVSVSLISLPYDDAVRVCWAYGAAGWEREGIGSSGQREQECLLFSLETLQFLNVPFPRRCRAYNTLV